MATRRDRGRRRLSQSFDRTHASIERPFRNAVNGILLQIADAASKRLKAAGTLGVTADELFEPAEFRERFERTVARHLAAGFMGGVAFERQWIESAGLKQFALAGVLQKKVGTVPPSFHVDLSPDQQKSLREFLRNRQVGIWNRVARTTHHSLRRGLLAGIKAGDTFDELQGRVQKRLEHYADWQARRVARTETTGAMNNAQQVERDEVGIEYKGWLTTIDDRARQTHFDANGQIVPNRDPFLVGSARLMYPVDSSLGAPAAETVNCRCVSVAEFGPGSTRPLPATETTAPLDSVAPVQVPAPSPPPAPKPPTHITFSGKPTELSRRVWDEIGDGIRDEAHARRVGRILREEIDGELVALRGRINALADGARKLPPGSDVASMQKEVRTLKNDLSDRTQTAVLGRLKQVRDVGGVEHELAGAKKVHDAVRAAEQKLPQDWMQASKRKGKITTRGRARGYWNGKNRELAINRPDATDTALHELVHASEDAVRQIGELEKAFKLRRAKGEKLSKIYPGTQEMGYKDEFTEHYIGKEYATGADKYHEVLSVGLEGLLHGNYGVHTDADLVEFVLGVLAGV